MQQFSLTANLTFMVCVAGSDRASQSSARLSPLFPPLDNQHLQMWFVKIWKQPGEGLPPIPRDLATMRAANWETNLEFEFMENICVHLNIFCQQMRDV